MNMSYCRFHNTALALQDCLSVLEEMREGRSEKLSEAELRAAKGLSIDCLRLVELVLDEDLLRSDGETEVKESALEDAVEKIQVEACAEDENPEEDEDDE